MFELSSTRMSGGWQVRSGKCRLGVDSHRVRSALRSRTFEALTSYLVVFLEHTREASVRWIQAVCGRFGFSRGVHRCIDGISLERTRLRAFLFRFVRTFVRSL